jgi:hypothetical protein
MGPIQDGGGGGGGARDLADRACEANSGGVLDLVVNCTVKWSVSILDRPYGYGIHQHVCSRCTYTHHTTSYRTPSQQARALQVSSVPSDAIVEVVGVFPSQQQRLHKPPQTAIPEALRLKPHCAPPEHMSAEHRHTQHTHACTGAAAAQTKQCSNVTPVSTVR